MSSGEFKQTPLPPPTSYPTLVGLIGTYILLSFAPSAAAGWHCDFTRRMCERNSVRHDVCFKLSAWQFVIIILCLLTNTALVFCDGALLKNLKRKVVFSLDLLLLSVQVLSLIDSIVICSPSFLSQQEWLWRNLVYLC